MKSVIARRMFELGQPEIERLIGSAEEGLHLEFKQTYDRSGHKLSRDDRRNIARTISGFANADGGVLALGFDARKNPEGADVLNAAHPYDDVDRIYNTIAGQIGDMISPEVPDIKFHKLITDDASGYLFIEVPPSPRRPHMSNIDHSYHRRGDRITRLMEEFEVRELIFAVREGQCELSIIPQLGMHNGTIFQFNILLAVKNVGEIPVFAPYMKIEYFSTSTVVRPLIERRDLTARSHRPSIINVATERTTMLPPDDEIPMAFVETGIAFDQKSYVDFDTHVAASSASRDNSSFRIGRVQLHHGIPNYDVMPAISITIGAENAVRSTSVLNPSKEEMFKIISGVSFG